MPVLAALAQVSTPADDEERCADCHAALVANYAKTGMANALRPLDGVDFSGLAIVPDGTSGFRYRFAGEGASARWFRATRPTCSSA